MPSLRLPLLASFAIALLVGCNSEIPIPVNPPEARKDYARTALDTPVTLAPRANDYDADDATLTVVAVGAAAHGTAVLNPDQTVTYTPNLGYLGGDTFTVTVTDPRGNEVTESAYISVGPSTRFVYRSNFEDYFTFELYLSDSLHPDIAIPVSARIPRTVGPTRPGATISNYVLTADGRYLVYLLDEPDSPINNLYFVDLEQPGVAIQLTDLEPGQAVNAVSLPEISADGQFVYYLSNETNPATFEVMRVEVANLANRVRMNAATTSHVVTNTDGTTSTVWGSISRFALADDQVHMLFVEFDPNSQGPGVTARELHVLDVGVPGVSTVISGTPTTGTAGVFESFFTSGLGFVQVPGTDYVVYPATEGGSTFTDLYLVDFVAQSAPVKLSGTALAVGVTGFRVASDSAHIVYFSAETVSTVKDIYLVALANPGVSTRLSKLRTANAAVANFLIGPDSTYVVYQRDDDTEGITELYRVDFNNPTVQVKLNHALRPAAPPFVAEEVNQIQMSSGAPRTILYSTNDLPVEGYTTQTVRAMSVDAPGSGTPIGIQTGVNFVFLFAPDGNAVTMFNDPLRLSVNSAFRTELSDPDMMVKLTPEKYSGATVTVSTLFPFLP